MVATHLPIVHWLTDVWMSDVVKALTRNAIITLQQACTIDDVMGEFQRMWVHA